MGDTKKKKVPLVFEKPYRCTDVRCCLPCGFFYHCGCIQQMDVIANGTKIGYVKEQYGTWICSGKWSAFDMDGNERLRVQTNCCQFFTCCCCKDITFEIEDKD